MVVFVHFNNAFKSYFLDNWLQAKFTILPSLLYLDVNDSHSDFEKEGLPNANLLSIRRTLLFGEATLLCWRMLKPA